MLTSGHCGTLGDLLILDFDAAVDDFTECGQIILGISPEGEEAIRAWQSNDEFYPFAVPEYADSIYSDGFDMDELSEEHSRAADEADENGDDYELAVTLLTVVLFFAGISLVVRGTRLRMILLVGSAAVLIASSIYMLSLPLA